MTISTNIKEPLVNLSQGYQLVGHWERLSRVELMVSNKPIV